jgi:hypothetical protein
MRPLSVALAALAAALLLTGSAFTANESRLDMYTATVDRATVDKLARKGIDIAATQQVAGGVRLDLVLSARQRDRLAAQGIGLALKRNKDGLTVQEQAAAQAEGGFDVWRSWDEQGGIRDELYELARRNRSIVKLEVIGHSLQGREIIALKLTKNANQLADGARPDVFYMATIHAREWIAAEVGRRLLRYFVDNYGKNDEVTNLVNTRELWFVPVANPDGYQHSFDVERLWRKNLRDNNGDGRIEIGDGVDNNRNYDEKWNYDNEGSSSVFSADDYRGTAAASEPETVAIQELLKRLKFRFMVTYHSYGELLLYMWGFQVQTPTADDPIYVAMSGTDAKPAIPGYDPGVGADLYITNGTTDDYAHAVTDALGWTPELSEGCDGCGFVFPDDEALIEAEFQKNLPFALDVARSAPNPAQPVSHLGNTTKPFYLDVSALDPEKTNNPMSDFRFSVSHGDPQPVQVLARRSLGAVTLKYRINNGAIQDGPTSEWNGGERFGDTGDVHYRIMRGRVTGTTPGDVVTVWFEASGGAVKSDSFTYTAKVESSNRVLVLAAEDYTGISPVYKKTDGPTYLSYYLDALTANGIGADVYDVDANGRTAPSPLGVLGHYDAVIWYTGDDILTRDPGMVAGTASRLANDEILAIRAYLNEGGRLLRTGKNAGLGEALGYEFNLETNAPCNPDSAADGCEPLQNDFLQYYLGAYLYNDDAGTTANGKLYDVFGVDTPFDSLRWAFGGPSANNQDHSASFIPTSAILPVSTYPLFKSWPSAKYDRPGGAFDPHTGSFYAYSNIADISYKRLTRTISVPAGGANLSFWVSHDTEQDWDFVFVEAHTVGQADWTTLPDLNGHTGTSTGDSCPEGWRELHPFLDHYQTLNADDTCSPTGTTGAWNADSGSSGGWVQWSVDLSAYAGKQVEVSIAYASDWSVQGLGAFVDDIVVSTGEGTTSFETGMDGWTVTGPAARLRAELEQLRSHHRGRVPRGRGDHNRRLGLLRVRVGGNRNTRRPERGHGESDGLPPA